MRTGAEKLFPPLVDVYSSVLTGLTSQQVDWSTSTWFADGIRT